MSYSTLCYKKVYATLTEFAPIQPVGQAARRLIVFTLMIVGLVRAGNASLSKMANKSPKHKDSKTESRTKRFKRWLQKDTSNEETFYFPYVKEILAGMSNATLVFSIDASSLGKHCAVLMVSVIYNGRALPIMWEVKKGNKGSFGEEAHTKLLARLAELLKELEEDLEKELDVVIVGDGEFDGIGFQQACEGYGWSYVLRAAKNINCYEGGS